MWLDYSHPQKIKKKKLSAHDASFMEAFSISVDLHQGLKQQT